jgi:hypothetical protein
MTRSQIRDTFSHFAFLRARTVDAADAQIGAPHDELWCGVVFLFNPFDSRLRSGRVGSASVVVNASRSADVSNASGTFRPGFFDGVFRVALTSHEPRIDGPTHACRVSTGAATFRTSMYVYTVWKCVSTQKRDGSQGEEVLHLRVCTFVCVYSIRECVDPTVTNTLDGCRPGAFG